MPNMTEPYWERIIPAHPVWRRGIVWSKPLLFRSDHSEYGWELFNQSMGEVCKYETYRNFDRAGADLRHCVAHRASRMTETMASLAYFSITPSCSLPKPISSA